MFKYESIDFYDFTFGDKNLSDFGGYIGSDSGGLKTFSVLPSRSYTVEKPLGSNVTTVYGSSLEPRTFTVPVVFEEITDWLLRNLAMWLDSPEDKKFQFVGDNAYINARLDSTAFDISSKSGVDGEMELKFICHDPFYYSVGDISFDWQVSTDTYILRGVPFEGYENYFKIIVGVNGNLEIDFTSYDGDTDNLTTHCRIENITGGVIIDGITKEVTSLSGANMYNSFSGDFPRAIGPKLELSFRSDNRMSSIKLSYIPKFI